MLQKHQARKERRVREVLGLHLDLSFVIDTRIVQWCDLWPARAINQDILANSPLHNRLHHERGRLLASAAVAYSGKLRTR